MIIVKLGLSRMPSIWTESLDRSFAEALELLAASVRDCTDELWNASMWEVPGNLFGEKPQGPDGKPVVDPELRRALVQRRSAPWSVAWHALECLDYDLAGEFEPWAPPPPFTGKPHWQMTSMPAGWSRADILTYIAYCRRRVGDTMADLTEEKARQLLPPSHRYGGRPHAWIITGAMGHTIEHATQIRQFITSEG
jgi:hypothetical protein